MQGYGLSIAVALISAALLYFIFSPSRPSSAIYADDTLVRAIIFFRHADRGPISTYPKDPHPFTDKAIWRHGSDGLTKKGKQDSYALGKLLRKRYQNLLPEVYYPADIITYSTNKERTHTTAALVLAGLYPPTAEELWSEELLWQPIPIYGDIIFNNSVGISCPRFKEEVISTFASRNESFVKENEEILTYIGQHTGLNLLKDPFISLISVGDCLNMQSRFGLELPDWAKDIFPHKIFPLMTEIYNRYSLGSETQLQLGGGLLIQRILNLLKMGKRKLYLNSAHDITLMMLQGVIGVPKPVAIPHPTGTVIVELHNVSGDNIVKAYLLQNSSYHHFEPLQMNCGLNECLINDFESMTTNYTVDDYQTLCNEVTKPMKPDSVLQGLVGTSSIPIY